MAKVFSHLCSKSVSRRTQARLLAAVFFLSLIPLMLIALYNYPAADDYGYALPGATAWVQTGSLGEVARAIADKVKDTYFNWQGAFASSLHMACSPMIFCQRLYFISNWTMLALLCLSIGYLLKGILRTLPGADRSTFWIVYATICILTIQFMPSISDGIYWHTGGVYTITAIMALFMLGLIFRSRQPQSLPRALWRGACLAVLGVLVGGGNYGAMLGAFTLLVLLTIHAFVCRDRSRFHCLVGFVFLTAAMIISVAAPGNSQRFAMSEETLSVSNALVTSVLDSFDLFGELLTPQLLAALMLILPVMWEPLKQSEYRFRHPLLVFVALYGLFAAAIVPGVYTQSDYLAGRYYNILYIYFLVLAIGSALYAEGWLIRLLESRQDSQAVHLMAAAQTLGARFGAVYLALCIALTAFGGFAFTIMNTSSVSAIKSLVTGEASRFQQDMLERQEYIRITDSDVTAVQPLDGQPYVFKQDHLAFQGIYGRIRYMKMYFELFYNAQNP